MKNLLCYFTIFFVFLSNYAYAQAEEEPLFEIIDGITAVFIPSIDTVELWAQDFVYSDSSSYANPYLYTIYLRGGALDEINDEFISLEYSEVTKDSIFDVCIRAWSWDDKQSTEKCTSIILIKQEE